MEGKTTTAQTVIETKSTQHGRIDDEILSYPTPDLDTGGCDKVVEKGVTEASNRSKEAKTEKQRSEVECNCEKSGRCDRSGRKAMV